MSSERLRAVRVFLLRRRKSAEHSNRTEQNNCYSKRADLVCKVETKCARFVSMLQSSDFALSGALDPIRPEHCKEKLTSGSVIASHRSRRRRALRCETQSQVAHASSLLLATCCVRVIYCTKCDNIIIYLSRIWLNKQIVLVQVH